MRQTITNNFDLEAIEAELDNGSQMTKDLLLTSSPALSNQPIFPKP